MTSIKTKGNSLRKAEKKGEKDWAPLAFLSSWVLARYKLLNKDYFSQTPLQLDIGPSTSQWNVRGGIVGSFLETSLKDTWLALFDPFLPLHLSCCLEWSWDGWDSISKHRPRGGGPYIRDSRNTELEGAWSLATSWISRPTLNSLSLDFIYMRRINCLVEVIFFQFSVTDKLSPNLPITKFINFSMPGFIF